MNNLLHDAQSFRFFIIPSVIGEALRRERKSFQRFTPHRSQSEARILGSRYLPSTGGVYAGVVFLLIDPAHIISSDPVFRIATRQVNLPRLHRRREATLQDIETTFIIANDTIQSVYSTHSEMSSHALPK